MTNNSKHRLIIVHFQPLEKYPPVMNLIRFLESNSKKPLVITQKAGSSFEEFGKNLDTIYRINSVESKSRFLRLLAYSKFVLFSFFKLMKTKPKTILYFESISSLPVMWYLSIFPKTRIFVHYHEYTSPEEYERGMIFNRISHKVEMKKISKFSWISHTNEHRVKLFKENILKETDQKVHILPNYPPRTWLRKEWLKMESEKDQLKLVFVGALGLHSMYIREVCDWVKSQGEKLSLDIYSHQADEDASEFIAQYAPHGVEMKGPVPYFDLSEALIQYDVGLILYKGLSDNYKYNATNKYFEYTDAGLDVWFPEEMLGLKEFINLDTIPKTRSLDFTNLSSMDAVELYKREKNMKESDTYYCETEYLPLLKALYA